jgi:hypothetical protein
MVTMNVLNAPVRGGHASDHAHAYIQNPIQQLVLEEDMVHVQVQDMIYIAENKPQQSSNKELITWRETGVERQKKQQWRGEPAKRIKQILFVPQHPCLLAPITE